MTSTGVQPKTSCDSPSALKSFIIIRVIFQYKMIITFYRSSLADLVSGRVFIFTRSVHDPLFTPILNYYYFLSAQHS